MNEHTTSHQIIRDEGGNPLFVVVPYSEYMAMHGSVFTDGENDYVPLEVADFIIQEGCSPMKAWRKHLGLTQGEVAERMGIKQASYSRMEQPGVVNQRETMDKFANALGIRITQLNI